MYSSNCVSVLRGEMVLYWEQCRDAGNVAYVTLRVKRENDVPWSSQSPVVCVIKTGKKAVRD
jgi:hypothetical protein